MADYYSGDSTSSPLSSDEDSESVFSFTSSSCASTSDRPSTVYVGGFPPFVTEAHLRKHFSPLEDHIKSVHIIRDKETKISRGFGFVQFTSEEIAERAIIAYNKTLLLNKHSITVKKKREKKTRPGSSQSGSRRSRGGRRKLSSDDTKNNERKGWRHSSTDEHKSDHKPREKNFKRVPSKDIVKVWVGNLSSSTTKDDLVIHFGAFKERMVKPIQNIYTGKNDTHFTFLSFSSLDDANDVMKRMNQTTLKGKKIQVQLSLPKETPPVTPPTSPITMPTSTITTPKVPLLKSGTNKKTHLLDSPPITHATVPIISGHTITGPTNIQSAGAHINVPLGTNVSFGSQPTASIHGTTTVTLTNIATSINEDELKDLLAHYSPINIKKDSSSMTAVVSFTDLTAAEKAVSELNGQKFLGNTISAVISPQNVPSSLPIVKESCTMKIFNLSPTTNKGDIFNCCKRFGRIKGRVSVIETATPMYSIVNYVLPDCARRAVKELNGTVFKGSQWHVSLVTLRDDDDVVNECTSLQAYSSIKVTHSEKMSKGQYDLWFGNSCLEIENFKKSGGTLEFNNGALNLEAQSQTDLDEFLKIIKSYTERILECTPDQWNQLVLVNEFGVSKLEELKAPFASHPNLTIQERTPLKVVFTGTIAAVDSAYYHFYNELNRDLIVDSAKLESLVELMPDLNEIILKKHKVRVNGYCLGSSHLTFIGNSAQISLARKEIESTLSNIKQITLPDLPTPLIRAGVKLLKSQGLSLIVIEKDSQNMLISSSPNIEQEIKVFNRKPYTNTVTIDTSTSSDVTLSTLEDCISPDTVHITLNEDTIVLEGFDKDEVQLARKEIHSLVTSAVKQERLFVSFEQRAYLKRKFKETPEIKSNFPNLVFRRGDNMYIQGTQDEQQSTTVSLLSLIPPHYTTVTLQCDRRNCPLIEQYLLTPNNVEVIQVPDRRGGASSESGQNKELKLMLYSQEPLEEYCTLLKDLTPGTIRIPVNPQAKELVEQIKPNIEKACHCKIVLLNRPHAFIHYLKLTEGQQAKRLINDSIRKQLVVFKHLPSPPIPILHLKFLMEMYKEHFEECSKGLKLFQLPKIGLFDTVSEDETQTIKVKGTLAQVDAVREVLDELIGEKQFYCKRFILSVNVPYFLIHMWQKRWKQLKSIYRAELDVMFEYKVPPKEDRGKFINQIEFCIYGFNEFAFGTFKMQLSKEMEQPLWEQDIQATPERVKEVLVAIQNHTLDFKDYCVDVYCNEKSGKIVVRAPQVSSEDIEFVYGEIQTFLAHTTVIAVEIDLPDVPTYLMFVSKEQPYFKKILSVAKELKVTLRPYRQHEKLVLVLKGIKAHIESLHPIIKSTLASIETLLDQISVSVDPLALPCLTPNFCKELNTKLESTYMTVLIKATPPKATPTVSSSNGGTCTWYWEDDSGSYVPYDLITCQDLNDSYRSDPNGYYIIIKPGEALEVNFAQMVQLNLQTRVETNVKYIPTGSAIESVQWYWTNDDGTKLMPYTSQQSRCIEDKYTSKTRLFRMCINKHLYLMDIDRMIQTNESTGKRRIIKRKSSSSSSVQQEAKGSVILCGPKDNLTAASQFVQTKLTSSVKTNEITHPLIDNQQFYREVQRIASRHNVKVNTEASPTQGGGFGSLFFKGVSYCINKVMREVQERINESQPTPTEVSEEMEVPPEWERQDTNLQLFQVSSRSHEYRQVESLFQKTLPAKIISITRIQNLWLYERHVQHRKRLASKNRGITNELDLFHGSRTTSPREIYSCEDGFDARFCVSGMWGQANYFAVNANYSHSYAHVNSFGQRELFLVKVLTGDAYESQPNTSLRMPPKKTTSTSRDIQMRYDTVTGITKGTRVYMTYDNNKAYPAYVITYS